MNNLNDFFNKKADLYKNKICIKAYDSKANHYEEILSYTTFNLKLKAMLQYAINVLGVERGKKIAIISENSLDNILLIFSQVVGGNEVFLISPKLQLQYKKKLIQEVGCEYLFVSDQFYEDLVGDSYFNQFSRIFKMSQIAGVEVSEQKIDIKTEVNGEKTAVILHTSGTTALPKIRRLSHRNILSNQTNLSEVITGGWDSCCVSYSFLPQSHAYGLFGEILSNFNLGAETILHCGDGIVSAEQIIDGVMKTESNCLFCVPWILDQLLILAKSNPDYMSYLTKLKFVVSAGAPLQQEIGDDLIRNNINLVSSVGMTEAAGSFLYSSFSDTKNWEHYTIFCDKNIVMKQTKDENIYELTFDSSPMISKSVYVHPNNTTIFRTGDLFYKQEIGWKYLSRNDYIYNSPNGEKVNPIIFEKMLEGNKYVEKVYLEGRGLNYNILFIKIKKEFQGIDNVRDKVREYIMTNINPKVESWSRVYPSDINFLTNDDELPLTGKNLVDRNLAKKLLIDSNKNNRILEDFATLNLKEVLISELAIYLNVEISYKKIKDKNLSELGLDSMMILSLKNSLEKKYDIQVPTNILFSGKSIADILKLTTMPFISEKQDIEVIDSGIPYPILLEQSIYLAANNVINYPTYNMSLSVLADSYISPDELKVAFSILEKIHSFIKTTYTKDHFLIFRDEDFFEKAFLGESMCEEEGDIVENKKIKEIINDEINKKMDFYSGPLYKFGSVIINSNGSRRSLIYMICNHILVDFAGFNILIKDLIYLLQGGNPSEMLATIKQYLLPIPKKNDIQALYDCWANYFKIPQQDLSLEGDCIIFEIPEAQSLLDLFKENKISIFYGLFTTWLLVLKANFKRYSSGVYSMFPLTTRDHELKREKVGPFCHILIAFYSLDLFAPFKENVKIVEGNTLKLFNSIYEKPDSEVVSMIAKSMGRNKFLDTSGFLFRNNNELFDTFYDWRIIRNDYFSDKAHTGITMDIGINPRKNSFDGVIRFNKNFTTEKNVRTILASFETALKELV